MLIEKLRSVLAQLELKFQINFWEGERVPFKTYQHVPEKHPITGKLFCKREVEGHVLTIDIPI